MARSIERTLCAVALVLFFVNCAFAHTYLSSLRLNGQALNEGDCVRPHPDQQKEYPLYSVESPDMTCGWLPAANRPANRKCPIAAGSKIGLQWFHTNPIPSDFIMEGTHKGPIMVYLAKSENGQGNVWFKIYEAGYDAATRTWATDKMIANRGILDGITIPADIAPGNYLLRAEVLALHNAYDVYGIQPYVHCAELTITGTGSATPQGVAFPGAYTPSGPGMLFDLYKSYNSYTIPGPAIYSSPSTPSNPTSAPSNPTSAPSNPTSAPPVAPTTRPNYPTYPPATNAPATNAPTSAPSSNAGNMKVQLNGGSGEWWVGVKVFDAKEQVAKVEVKDSVALPSWAPCSNLGYAWVFSESVKMTAPLSVRITSVSGKQVELYNIFTSWDLSSPIDTGKNFA